MHGSGGSRVVHTVRQLQEIFDRAAVDCAGFLLLIGSIAGLHASGEKSYFKVNSLTSATLDSTFFQIFFSPFGLCP